MPEMNDAGFALLKKFEGCILFAYDDANDQPVKPGQHVSGTLTIGYGHTGSDVFPGLVWTQDQANEGLQHDIEMTAGQISKVIKVALNDNQFSAFCCFAFNIGVQAFFGSSALHLANTNQFAAVPDHMMLWDKTTINGHVVVSRGLAARRKAETVLWAKPMPASVAKTA